MDIIFNSLEELYERITPALRTKTNEMRRLGLHYIREEDIWNYLKEIKWKDSKSLLLYQMVDDIINCENYKIDEYLKKKLNLKNRQIYFNK